MWAKAPVPGAVKTRLIPALGEQGAADLARALLADTLASVSRATGVRPVLASTTDDTAAFGVDVPEIWLQGDGDLGARLERVMRLGLQEADAVLCIGADSPGVPVEALEAAASALVDGADAVVGPASDGGYWLIGVRACPPGLLAALPWSQPHTLLATRERFEGLGWLVREVTPWFDVDEPDDLPSLLAWLAHHPDRATHTRRVLT